MGRLSTRRRARPASRCRSSAVLKHQEQGLHLAFAQQHALEPVKRALAALRRVEVQEGAVVRHGVQERQQGGEGVLERLIEGQHLPGDLARIVRASSPSSTWQYA